MPLAFLIGSLIYRKIGGGFIGFGALSLYGVWQIVRVWRGETRNWLGEKNAPDWSYVAFGLTCQVPLVLWILFLKGQGLFGSSLG